MITRGGCPQKIKGLPKIDVFRNCNFRKCTERKINFLVGKILTIFVDTLANDLHLIISAVWLGLFLMITVTTSTRNIRAASKEIKIRSETFSGLLIQVHLDLLYAIHKTYKISILHCYDALNELLCTILLPLLIKTGVSLLLMKIITWKDIEEDHYC